jgi:hypothetical protein
MNGKSEWRSRQMPNIVFSANLHWQQMFDFVMGNPARRAAMAQGLGMNLAAAPTATILGTELAQAGLPPITQHEVNTLNFLDANYPDTMIGFRSVVAVALNAQPVADRPWLPRLRVEFDHSTLWPTRVEVTAYLNHGQLSSVIVFPLGAYDQPPTTPGAGV